MLNTDFWISFWPNFWASLSADLLVGIVLAGFISWVIAMAKRPNAVIVVSPKKISDTKLNLEISIRNIGKISFKSEEIYYHVIVNDALSPKELEGQSATTNMNIFDKQYTNFKGIMKAPCFVGRGTNVSILTVDASAIHEGDVLYFLSTAHGIIPRSVMPRESMVIEASKLGKAIIEPIC
jgi:hypothetical protein